MDNKNQVTHNPDVLCCLANLSNDEVFTPPQLANEVLDLLPKEIWSDPTITFLDPCCKTGVFLREITIRLIEGLKDEIPNLQERINHILTKQVFGIAITELTALITRRTLYCSKEANGKYSVCTEFGHSGGNIYYNPNIKHEWKGKTCNECGASKDIWNRDKELESHAYAFIHKPIKEIFNMKFDVIIGNPPYQLNVGGGNGANAMPLYHKFIQKAKLLNPNYITMIIPAKWYNGGRNLDDFRDEMINDKHIAEIHDFKNSKDCFDSIELQGGVCYFLWDKTKNDPCKFFEYENNDLISCEERYLKNNFSKGVIRYNRSISIVNKIALTRENSFSNLVSSQTPFGLNSNFKEFTFSQKDGYIKLIKTKKQGEKDAYVNRSKITKNSDLINSYKVYFSLNYGAGMSGNAPYKVIATPFIGEKNTCCTQSYLMVAPLNNKIESENVISYMHTKFFRFLTMLSVAGQTFSPNTFSLVPIQDFSKPWTDQELYEKYGLTQDEIDYIESMIRPMDSKED